MVGSVMNIGELRKLLAADNYICFTADLDWAAEHAIEDLLKAFEINDIKPTVFLTHPSKVIDKCKDKIDTGIHPNFIQPSSQGKTQDEIVDYCRRLAPDTEVFRSHKWYGDNDIYDKLWNRGFRYESNLCTNMDETEPFIHRSGMVSFPVFLEDGSYIIKNKKIDFEDVRGKFEKNGLKVVNIHPMHYALNTPYFSYTREIKDRLSREEWNNLQPEDLDNLSYKGAGIRSFIEDLFQFSKKGSAKVITLKQMYEMLFL